MTSHKSGLSIFITIETLTKASRLYSISNHGLAQYTMINVMMNVKFRQEEALIAFALF